MKLLKYAALAYGGYWLYGKFNAAKNAYKSITAKVVNISDVKILASGISFNLDAELGNPTDHTISLNGDSLIKLKLARFLDENGNVLGTANVEANAIQLQPMSTQTITNIPVTMATANIPAAIDVLSNSGNVTMQLNFEVLNQPLTINS